MGGILSRAGRRTGIQTEPGRHDGPKSGRRSESHKHLRNSVPLTDRPSRRRSSETLGGETPMNRSSGIQGVDKCPPRPSSVETGMDYIGSRPFDLEVERRVSQEIERRLGSERLALQHAHRSERGLTERSETFKERRFQRVDSHRKNRPPALQEGVVRMSAGRQSPDPLSTPPLSTPELTTPANGTTSSTHSTSPESVQAAAFTHSLCLDSNMLLSKFRSTAPEPLDDDGDTEAAVVSLAELQSLDQDSDVRTIGNIQRWQRGNLIGSGSFGKVYLGMNLDSGELFVVKQVMFSGRGEQEDVMQLEQEIALLGTLLHDNIVQYLGTERNNISNELSIFLEHMPGGSVAELVQRFGRLDESVIRKYTREALAGLIYLHERGIIHRDIKGQNILVDNRGVCKLADFGASRYLKQDRDSAVNLSFKGTPVFMSPEVIMEQRYSKKSDVWSIGCTLLQMATGNPPFSEFSNHIAALFHITSSTEPPPLPDHLSDPCRAFVLQCFIRDPKDRPHAQALRRHPFLERKSNTTPSSTTSQPSSSKAGSVGSPAAEGKDKEGREREPKDPRPPKDDLEESHEEAYKRFKEKRMKQHKVTAYIRRGASRGPSLKSGLTSVITGLGRTSSDGSCTTSQADESEGIHGLGGKT